MAATRAVMAVAKPAVTEVHLVRAVTVAHNSSSNSQDTELNNHPVTEPNNHQVMELTAVPPLVVTVLVPKTAVMPVVPATRFSTCQ